MSVELGLVAFLEAKPDKAEELGAFLQQGGSSRPRRRAGHWYAFRVNETTFGIFDTFETEDGRQAHLNGEIPRRSVRSAGICWRRTPTSARSTSSP